VSKSTKEFPVENRAFFVSDLLLLSARTVLAFVAHSVFALSALSLNYDAVQPVTVVGAGTADGMIARLRAARDRQAWTHTCLNSRPPDGRALPIPSGYLRGCGPS
jgi:hypothetical protein